MANWTVTVCTSLADRITLQAGPADDDNDVFAEWRHNDGPGKSFDLPDRCQNLGRVYFQANNNPDGRQTEICVKFQGAAKKHMSFDGDNEWHYIETGDSDDCPC
jgi:hypothetical protein